MGSESLILLCQFESICLSCFRIVIDFLLFSLIFFFFQCFSMTTLTVIIKSAFDLFWLPYYMTFSQHVYFIFTVRKFGFCEIFALWITLISRSSVSQDTISLWTTSSAPMSHCIRGSISENRKNKEVFVTMAQELSLFVIGCWSMSHSQIGLSYSGLIFACVQTLPTPSPPTTLRKKIGEREVVSLPACRRLLFPLLRCLPDSFCGVWEGGGGRLYTGYLILTFRWASQYSLSLATIVNLRIFIYTWRASNEGLFWKSISKPSLKITPCQTADNVKTTGHNIKWDHFEIKGRVNQINWIVTDCKIKDQDVMIFLNLSSRALITFLMFLS